MIDGRRTHTNINREDIERFLHKAGAIVERNTPVQLRGWHPKLLLRVDPHRIHPEETLVANEYRHRIVG